MESDNLAGFDGFGGDELDTFRQEMMAGDATEGGGDEEEEDWFGGLQNDWRSGSMMGL